MSLLFVAANAQDGISHAGTKEGKRLGLDMCTPCHVVSRDQPDPPILKIPTPNFEVLAKRKNTSEESLRTFILTTHETLKNPNSMPNPELTDAQAAEIAAYIVSLKRVH